MARQIDKADTETKLEEIGRRLEKFHDTLDTLTILTGFVSSEPDVWEFKFNGGARPVRVSSVDLLTSNAFCSEYLNVFKRPAPEMKKSAWRTLLELWADGAETRQSENPGQAVLDALTLYDAVMELPTTGNPLKNHCAWIPSDIQGRRLVRSNVINWIKNRNNIFTTQEELNRVLIELGKKDDGYQQKKLDKTNVRWWWFIISTDTGVTE